MKEKKYYIERGRGIWGLLKDEDGNLFHSYREDSIILDPDAQICPTIKAQYGPLTSFWLCEEKDDK